MKAAKIEGWCDLVFTFDCAACGDAPTAHGQLFVHVPEADMIPLEWAQAVHKTLNDQFGDV